MIDVKWRKSSYSTTSSNSCVEVASLEAAIGVRDSKDRSGPILAFDATPWAAFVGAVKVGSFDLA